MSLLFPYYCQIIALIHQAKLLIFFVRETKFCEMEITPARAFEVKVIN